MLILTAWHTTRGCVVKHVINSVYQRKTKSSLRFRVGGVRSKIHMIEVCFCQESEGNILPPNVRKYVHVSVEIRRKL